jgi:hypothetical protein
MPPAIKSAFGKMTPRMTNGAGNTTANPRAYPQRPPLLPVGEPIKIGVELWLEVVDASDKLNPAFAYISRDHTPQKIVVVLNKHHWPTAGALSRSDSVALRWLVSLAVLDRCATWRSHPVLASVQRYLTELAIGRWLDYQACVWAAYRLKDHQMLVSVPELATAANASSQPQKITQFEVIVDSARLDFWRQKTSKRFKRQPLAA